MKDICFMNIWFRSCTLKCTESLFHNSFEYLFENKIFICQVLDK